ncbi:MAG: helix-turn-helix transcriptional regulator [Clostridia bacterium]|nr:helix-turn-helix transcriptional regulator [Clostridia bacterium]
MENNRMREARTKLHLSQGELARQIGVSRQTINMIENGGYNPTIELCIRICRALGLTLNDLFWEE